MKLRAGRSMLLMASFGVAALVLGSIRAVPIFQTRTRTVTSTPQPQALNGKKAVKGGKGATTTTTITNPVAGVANCGGGNRATDTGVTATTIKLGATVVRSGIGSSFLGGAPIAMKALANRVNAAGGICGRLIDLRMVDDGWDESRGVGYLRSLIAEGIFALAVSPSSQGVNALIKSGDLDKGRIPLVGADGMVKSEYLSPWVWPVATSTVSNMHIIVQQAIKRGFKTFGIVYDKDYHFGVEGAKAFNGEVRRLTGHDIPGYSDPESRPKCDKTFCGIQSGQPSYPEVSTFNEGCDVPNEKAAFHADKPSCDLIALLLEPKTALTWLANGGAAPGGGRTQGPQPLFNADFAKACGRQCAGMTVWTSFTPPISPFDSLPAVADYVQTVKRVDRSLDVTNSFTEGAYLGMAVLIQALQRVGPQLTRSALQQVLDQGSYDLGLAPALQWTPGQHLGNGRMMSYSFQYNGNAFLAFKQVSGFVADASLGRDMA